MLVRDTLVSMDGLNQEPLADEGLEFADSGSETDDSGLVDLVGPSQSQ